LGAEVRQVVEQARTEGRCKLLEHEALKLCELYGLPVPGYGLARSEEEVVELAERVGYPVVLKVVSPDISHKSDVGGVILGVRSAEEVRSSYRSLGGPHPGIWTL
jgi:acetyl-CoA synthetase (ADP-forming)